ncbi:MAG: DUF169 domain-containing protein [Methanomassiliicoccales archaeon]
MVDYASLADRMMDIIGFEHPPVAVTLVKEGMEVPEEYEKPEKKMSHCQSIMEARKGNFLYIPADLHSCPVGASSLGLVELPEKVASGEFHHGLGMFDSPEAAKRMIEERYELEYGSAIGTAVSPLQWAKLEPDAIVQVGLPEQIYWLVPAFTYKEGGRVHLSTAAFQATCVDSTLLPILTGKLSLSLGCFGCRRRTDIEEGEMMAGIPPAAFEEMVNALEKLAQGSIQRARRLDKEKRPGRERWKPMQRYRPEAR